MGVALRKSIVMVSFGLLFVLPSSAMISSAQIQASALQEDGSIVGVGTITINGISQGMLTRYTSNGIIDTSFGASGIVSALGLEPQAVVTQQADNKIVVAGCTITGSSQIMINRYNTDGTIDTSFGSNGSLVTLIGYGCCANSIMLDAHNNILIGGVAVLGGTPEFVVVRYTSSGILDTTFGGNGIVTTAIGIRAKGSAIALQSNGQIIVGGWASLNNTDQFTLARYNTDGSLDSSFGVGGVVMTQIGALAHLQSLAIQADDAIVAIGSSDSGFAAARYTAAGILDTTFNGTGIITGTGISPSFGIIDANNNVIIIGIFSSQGAITRYTTSGLLDNTFGSAGIALLTAGNVTTPQSAILQSNGEIIISGNADENFFIAGFSVAGLLDLSWGTQGIASLVIEDPAATMLAWEQEAVGTNSGTFNAGSWQTRVLNNSSSTLLNLVSNQFSLSPGKYTVDIVAPAYKVGNHQARLQNITNNITALGGTTAFSDSKAGSQTNSYINGLILVTQPTTFEIQHMCSNTQLNDGFGIAAGLGSAEIYTTVKIIPS